MSSSAIISTCEFTAANGDCYFEPFAENNNNLNEIIIIGVEENLTATLNGTPLTVVRDNLKQKILLQNVRINDQWNISINF
jgi:hypothetical protein